MSFEKVTIVGCETNESAEMIAQRVRRLIESEDEESCILLIIEVFIDPSIEGVVGGKEWRPNEDELWSVLDNWQSEGDRRSPKTMKSIRLYFQLRRVLTGRIKYLATTGNVKMSRRSEAALRTAFQDGRVARVYRFQDTHDTLAGLARYLGRWELECRGGENAICH